MRPKSEVRSPRSERNPKPEVRTAACQALSARSVSQRTDQAGAGSRISGFFRISSLGTAAQRSLGLLLALSLISGCLSVPRHETQPLSRFEFQEPQMGLPFRIVLYAPSQHAAETAARAAFSRIAELNTILSDYEDASELTLLSRSGGRGRAVPVGPDLWNVLSAAQALSRKTSGAFDVSVGPLVQLWRRARRERQWPAPNRLQEALQRCGYENIRLDPVRKTAQLTTTGMRLDLGAIAKGYATDQAIAVLKCHGVRSALVSGGGDMTAGDAPPGERGWNIEIGSGTEKRFVRIHNQGLATSGDLFQYFEHNGVRYSHIVDPKTGVGLTHRMQVTVIARTGMEADALSTAVSVLGVERGLSLIEQTPLAAASLALTQGSNILDRDSSRFAPHLSAPLSPKRH